MEWKSVSEMPEWDQRPGRQFIRLEGSRYHSDGHWHRVWAGEAFIRKSDDDDAILGYRAADIKRLCADGDMDVSSAVVTHWMPAIFPGIRDERPYPATEERH